MKTKFTASLLLALLYSTTVSYAQVATAQDTISMLQSQLSKLSERVNTFEQERNYEKVWKRKKYWKFMYGKPTLERNAEVSQSWKCDLSAQISRGRTGYFHSTPIGGMVKIGMDYGFFDVTYTKYNLQSTAGLPDDMPTDWPYIEYEDEDMLETDMHKLDYGWHVGPVVTINPWKHLMISLYAHFTPSASCLLENENYTLGYGLGYTYGASISYKVISLGVENTWTKYQYKQLQYDQEDHFGQFEKERFDLKQTGPRFYLSFRF